MFSTEFVGNLVSFIKWKRNEACTQQITIRSEVHYDLFENRKFCGLFENFEVTYAVDELLGVYYRVSNEFYSDFQV